MQKINGIPFQIVNKPNHPGVLLAWMEKGRLNTKNFSSDLSAFMYLIHSLWQPA